jgi:hypothetical protein
LLWLGKSSTTFGTKVVLDKNLRRAAAESKTPLRAPHLSYKSSTFLRGILEGAG